MTTIEVTSRYRAIEIPPCSVEPTGPTFEGADTTTWRAYRGSDGRNYLCELTRNASAAFTVRWYINEEG